MEWTDEPVLDSTGMFHWCRPVPLQQAVLTRRMAQKLNLRDHIVVGIIGEISSTLIGLQNFVMPLRTSNYTYQELKHIVFIGSLDYMKREWETIHNFPKLLVLPGCAQSCADLRAVGAHCCSMCAILTSNWRSTDSYYLEDTDSILATLNIQSMHLRDSAIIADPFRRWRAEESQVPESHRRIPVITELKNTSNIQFIEQIGELSARDTKRTLYMTTSFATGSVFSGSFLDSLMSTTYFNYQILALFQTLVTGGTTPELEEQLAEENKLKHSKNAAFAGSRDRCRLGLIPLTPKLLNDLPLATSVLSKEIVAMSVYVKVCVTVFVAPPLKLGNGIRYKHESLRYVIVRPPNDFKLLSTDLLFCAIPFNDVYFMDSRSSFMEVLDSLPDPSAETVQVAPEQEPEPEPEPKLEPLENEG
ncbi:potassium channel subfamily U member 1-like [Rhinatrema bivittatum]|uniref:potassium channel subfamily U member 1-like n=1 Tax=Rhinatrema bivittatum TaxID=194408 RepID=UPI00112E1B42|nr:potassium channel subfamily U member 1-like [Rhinatrema bivittatum]